MLRKLLDRFLKQDEASLKNRSLRAAAWTVLGRGGGELLRLASSMILTRLLFPEAFGVMATATVIITMVQLFSDTGVRLAIIQNPRGTEPEFLNTAWTISVIRGVGLTILLMACAYPIALFYRKPELFPLLMLIALSATISGVESPGMAVMARKLKAEKQVAYDLIPQFLGVACTATLAWQLRSVWALAIGYLLVSAFKCAASYLVAPTRPRILWDRTAAHEILTFGKFIALNTLISWSAMNLDRLMLGRMLGMEALGYYAIGYNIGVITEMFFMQVIGQSYFPAISGVIDDHARSVAIFRRTTTLILTVSLPVLTLLMLFPYDFLGLLYDSRYRTSGLVLFWIAFRGMFTVFSAVHCSTLLAFGKPLYETVSMAVGLALLAVLLPVGARYGQLPGVLVAVWSIGVVTTLVESFAIGIKLGFGAVVVRPWLQTALVAGSIWAAGSVLREYLAAAGVSVWVAIGIMIVVAFGVSGGVCVAMEGGNPFRDRGGARQG